MSDTKKGCYKYCIVPKCTSSTIKTPDKIFFCVPTLIKIGKIRSCMSYTALVLLLIGFFGFFLNLLVILLMWKDKQLWTPLNIILFNLVCSDFSVSILGNPWTLISAISHGWIWGRTMCVIYGFFMSLLGITSITTLTVLAFERFMIVSKPFQRKCLNRRNAGYIVLGIWIYSLILTTPPLFGWGKYVSEAANISCSVNWEDRSINAKTYIMYLFLFGLIVPLIVIVYSFTQIISTMRTKKMSMGQLCRMEARITYMILVMILAFLIAWTPYAVFALVAQFGDPTLISPATGVLPALIAKSSICYNPIIYVGLNSQFYQSVKQLLRKEPHGVNSTCETYTLAVSKCMSQNNTPEKQKMEVAILSKVDETIQENEELLESSVSIDSNSCGDSNENADTNNDCNNEACNNEPHGVNSTCETYTLVVSKCMSQNKTPEKQKIEVAILSKVEETIQENQELLESNV